MSDASAIKNQKPKIKTSLPLPVFREDFVGAARAAAGDEFLRGAMENSCVKKDSGRRELLKELPDAEGLRALAGRIKAHALEHLDYYVERLEAAIVRAGGQVHYAATGDEANELIVRIAQERQCKLVVKSKSMVSEETQLNGALIAAGIEPVETDLGELIVQLAGDHPSHLVMPVIHMRAKQIGEVFAKFFKVPFTEDPQALAELARVYLRGRFKRADMGISGVNFAVAETGSLCVCTNEGNGRMCTSRPRVHVALMGMEKVIPGMADLPVFLKLLARSASGQSLTQYTNIITGPRRGGEHDGPEELHLVVIDNGRSRILASEYRDTLRCIRCGACLNACPVYRTVGGHAYGSVYPGPIGALLVPLFNGLEHHADLPQATSLCGACFEACPVKINLPEMLIAMKRDLQRVGVTPWRERMLFRLWTMGLASGAAYRVGQAVQKFVLRRVLNSRAGWITRMPGPAKGWTQVRDFPVPEAKTFRQLWAQRQAHRADETRRHEDMKNHEEGGHDGATGRLASGASQRVNPFVHREPLERGGREVFLRRVRRALGHDGGSAPAAGPAPAVEESLVRQVKKDDVGCVERWLNKAGGNGIGVRRVAAGAVHEAVDACLAEHGVKRVMLNGRELAERFGLAAHLAGRGMETVAWGSPGCADAAFDCGAAITDCRAGMADAGSLLVWSDAGFGRASTLVAPVHVVLLPASRIVADMIDAVKAVIAEAGGAGGGMPSNVVMINGPSKTADIEMRLVTGVHGPKFLYVVLIEGM